MSQDYYQLLGVSPQASEDEIKKAYFAMAKKYHPDSGTEAELEKFHKITKAYKTLLDKKERKAYDVSMKAIKAEAERTGPSRGEGAGNPGSAPMHGNLYRERISPEREEELRQYHKRVLWGAVFRTAGLSLIFAGAGYIDFLLFGGLWPVSLLAGGAMGATFGVWRNFDLDSWGSSKVIKLVMGAVFVVALGYFILTALGINL